MFLYQQGVKKALKENLLKDSRLKSLELADAARFRRDRDAKIGPAVQILPEYSRSTAPEGEITMVQISLASPETIKALSVREIKEHLLNDKQCPKAESLNDPLMCPIERTQICRTCFGTIDTCPGHIAHINLPMPIYHVSFIKMVFQLLQIVCNSCSQIMLRPDQTVKWAVIKAQQRPEERRKLLVQYCKGIEYCGGPPPARLETLLNDKNKRLAYIKAHGCHNRQPVYEKNDLQIHCYERPVKPNARKTKAVVSEQKQEVTDGSDVVERGKRGRRAKKTTPPKQQKRVKRSASSGDEDDNEDPIESEPEEEEHEEDEEIVKDKSDEENENEEEEEEHEQENEEEDQQDDEEEEHKEQVVEEEEEEIMSVTESDSETSQVKRGSKTKKVSKQGSSAKRRKRTSSTASPTVTPTPTPTPSAATPSVSSSSSATAGDSEPLACGQKRRTRKQQTGEKLPFSAEIAREILSGIDDKSAEIMGFSAESRPEYAIMTVFPVAPPSIRSPSGICPSGSSNVTVVQQQGGGGDGSEKESQTKTSSKRSQGDNDATRGLKKILNAAKNINNELMRKQNLNLSAKERHDIDEKIAKEYDKMQSAGAGYIDNDASGVKPQILHNKTVPKGFLQRLKSKNGRVRGNLLSSRPNQSARTVAGPGPNLDLDQVGVPKEICMRLGIAEKVTQYNINRLQHLVRRGPDLYPGANRIVSEQGEVIDLKYARNARTNLVIGDTVERHLVNDDQGLLNRHPSLHEMSINGHRILCVEGKALLINLSACAPYNADFDGDEMNLHVPQTEEAQVETKEILAIHKRVRTQCSIGCVQNSLISGRLLTGRNILQTTEEMMQLQFVGKYYLSTWSQKYGGKGHLPHPAIICKGVPYWTGKQVASLYLPTVIQHGPSVLEPKSTPDIISDNVPMIVDGELVCGRFGKDVIGKNSTGVVFKLFSLCGDEVTRQWISDIQRLLNFWLDSFGFSVTSSDMVVPDVAATGQLTRKCVDFLSHWQHPKRKDYNQETKKSVSMANIAKRHTLIEQEEEKYVTSILKECQGHVGALVRKCNRKNSIADIVWSGAKGELVHLTQLVAGIGPALVANSRLEKDPIFDRTTPHWRPGDKDPRARGMIEGSYGSGLNPLEAFAQNCSSNQGLAESAKQIGTVGYLNRRIARATEDIFTDMDLSLRDLGTALTPLLGEDGFDPCWIESENIPAFHKSYIEIRDTFGSFDFDWSKILDEGSASENRAALLKDEIKEIVNRIVMLRSYRCLKLPSAGSTESREACSLPSARVQTPMHFSQALNRHMSLMMTRRQLSMHSLLFEVKSDLTPEYVVEKIQKFKVEALKALQHKTQLFSFFTLLHAQLCCKSVLVQHRLDKQQFDALMLELWNFFLRAICEPGTPNGTKTSHVLVAPSSQEVMRAFHVPGQQTVSSGMHRFEQILNASGKPQKCTVDIALLPNIQNNPKEMATLIRNLQPLCVHDTFESIFLVDHKTRLLTRINIPILGENKALSINGTIKTTIEKLCRLTLALESSESDAHVQRSRGTATATTVRRGRGARNPLCRFTICLQLKKSLLLSVGKTSHHVMKCLKALFHNKGKQVWQTSALLEDTWVITVRFRETASLKHMMEHKTLLADLQQQRQIDLALEKQRQADSATTPTTLSSEVRPVVVLESDALGSWSSSDERLFAPDLLQMLMQKFIDKMCQKKLEFHGVKGITAIRPIKVEKQRFNAKTGAVEDSTETILRAEADGNCLREIMCTRGVDASRVTTTNVYEVMKELGIQAGVNVLVRELKTLMQHHGFNIDYRYLHVLAYFMSKTGKLVAINRHGFNKNQDIEFLRRSSFETIVKEIIGAAAKGEKDWLLGCTNNSIVGKHVPIGTCSSFRVVPIPYDQVPMPPESQFYSQAPKPVYNYQQNLFPEQLTEDDMARLIPCIQNLEVYVPDHYTSFQTLDYTRTKKRHALEARQIVKPDYGHLIQNTSPPGALPVHLMEKTTLPDHLFFVKEPVKKKREKKTDMPPKKKPCVRRGALAVDIKKIERQVEKTFPSSSASSVPVPSRVEEVKVVVLPWTVLSPHTILKKLTDLNFILQVQQEEKQQNQCDFLPEDIEQCMRLRGQKHQPLYFTHPLGHY